MVEDEKDDLAAALEAAAAAAADAPRFGAFRVCNFSSVLIVVVVVVVAVVVVVVVVVVGVGGLVTESPSTAIAYDDAATAAAAAEDDDASFEVELDPDGVVVTPALLPTSLLTPLLLILLLLMRALRGRSAPTTVLRLLSEVIGTCATGASKGGPIAAWDTLMAKLPASASTPNTIPSFLPLRLCCYDGLRRTNL